MRQRQSEDRRDQGRQGGQHGRGYQGGDRGRGGVAGSLQGRDTQGRGQGHRGRAGNEDRQRDGHDGRDTQYGMDQGGAWEQDERQRAGLSGRPWEEQGADRSYGYQGMRGRMSGEDRDRMRSDDDGMRGVEFGRPRGRESTGYSGSFGGTGWEDQDGRDRQDRGFGEYRRYEEDRDGGDSGFGGFRGEFMGGSDAGYRGDFYSGGGYSGLDGSSGRGHQSFGDERRESRDMFGGFGSQERGKGPKGYTRSDDRIREDVCDRLGRRGDWSEVEVTVSNGEVTLSGTIADRRMKFEAEHIAEAVSGVQEIHNQLRIRREGQQTQGQGKQQTQGREGGEARESGTEDDQTASKRRNAGHATQTTRS